MRRRTILKSSVVSAGVMALLGAAIAVAAAPLAKGPPPDLDLIFTAQAVGWIEPCG